MSDQAVVTLDDGAVRLPDQMVALAAYGLAGSVRELDPGPFAAHEWFALLRECRAQELVGMLATATHDGALKLSEAQAEELAVVEREAAGISLLVEQRVLRLSAALSSAGLAHRALDGPLRARLAYRDSALRHHTSAVVLVDLAGERLVMALDPDASSSRHLPVEAPTGVRRGGATIQLSQLGDPPTMVTVADQPVPTATLEEHLVLACLDPATRLVGQRDVAELALAPGIDVERVRQVTESWQVSETVARALVGIWETFGLADRTPLSVWAARTAEPAALRRSVGDHGRAAARGRRRLGWRTRGAM
jgi:hypothetical protein